MTWTSLGTLTLSYDWQSFPVPVVGSETFRCLMPPDLPADGYVLITQYFSQGGVGRSQRIYPFNDPKIITLEIPRDFREANQLVRYIQAKKTRRVRIFGGQSWTLELEAFY